MVVQVRAELSSDPAALVRRLCALAVRGLPLMYRPDSREFAFTRADDGGNGTVALRLRGTSIRYAAIVALGVYWLPQEQQRAVLGGQSVAEYVAILLDRLSTTDNLGDTALVCWAAAQADASALRRALDRLAELDDPGRAHPVVEASWVVSALVQARTRCDVEAHLARARSRLLASQAPGSPLFSHATAPGLLPWYRTHVACFADQVYPIQALARLHASGDDPPALRAATRCADRICALQGTGGQWWWHYDARTGDLIEGYPVYTVHQHAMAPMALLDLAGAGGPSYQAAIERGLLWITDPAELSGVGGASGGGAAGLSGGAGAAMVVDDEGVTWRKVYRGDPHKLVRAIRGVTTRVAPGLSTPGVGRIYRPSAVDRECRPYELGWLLFAWRGGAGGAFRGGAGSAGRDGGGSDWRDGGVAR